MTTPPLAPTPATARPRRTLAAQRRGARRGGTLPHLSLIAQPPNATRFSRGPPRSKPGRWRGCPAARRLQALGYEAERSRPTAKQTCAAQTAVPARTTTSDRHGTSLRKLAAAVHAGPVARGDACAGRRRPVQTNDVQRERGGDRQRPSSKKRLVLLSHAACSPPELADDQAAEHHYHSPRWLSRITLILLLQLVADRRIAPRHSTLRPSQATRRNSWPHHDSRAAASRAGAALCRAAARGSRAG